MIEGGGSVSKKIREEAKSAWFCFFSSFHREQDQDLIKELLFWGYIYHDKDALVHLILPHKRRWNHWRRFFGVDAFPAVVLADDAKSPNDFILFSSSFLNQKPFQDPKNLEAILTFYHDKIVDGSTFADLKKKKVIEELSKLTKIALKQLIKMISISVN